MYFLCSFDFVVFCCFCYVFYTFFMLYFECVGLMLDFTFKLDIFCIVIFVVDCLVDF